MWGMGGKGRKKEGRSPHSEVGVYVRKRRPTYTWQRETQTTSVLISFINS